MNSPFTAAIIAPIPSKKNSRIVLKNGINIPSRAYRSWHRVQLMELKNKIMQHGVFTCPVSVNLGISFGDKHRRDIDNALTSVLDLIKDAGLIKDDCWELVPKINVSVIDTRADYAVLNVTPCTLPNIE